MSEPSDPLSVQSVGIATAVIAPVMMGCMAQIALWGFLLSHLSHTTKIWARGSRLTKWTVIVVMLLNTGFTASNMHNIWHYSVLPDRTFYSIISGTYWQTVEPAILGMIATIVQFTLAFRATKIMDQRLLRYPYLLLVCSLSIVGFIASIGLSGNSVLFHQGYYGEWGPLSFEQYFAVWMWADCACDVTITVVYLLLLYRRMYGQNSTSNSVLRMIAQFSLRSAAFTAVFAAASAATSQGLGGSYMTYDVCYAFFEPLGSLYTLSLLTTLSIASNVTATLGNQVGALQAHKIDMSQSSRPTEYGQASTLSAALQAPTGSAGTPGSPNPRLSMRDVAGDGSISEEKTSDDGKAFGWARGGGRRGGDDSLV